METVQTDAKVHYKYCIVPKCTNTTVTAPDKHFFTVPKDKKTRDKWCKVMKRKEFLSDKSVRYCCEDHFNVEEDTENFMRHRLVGGRLFLKKHVLPHKFACQKAKPDIQERSAFAKRRRNEHNSQVLPMEVPVSVAQQQPPEFIDICIKEEKDPDDSISVPVACADVNITVSHQQQPEFREICIKEEKDLDDPISVPVACTDVNFSVAQQQQLEVREFCIKDEKDLDDPISVPVACTDVNISVAQQQQLEVREICIKEEKDLDPISVPVACTDVNMEAKVKIQTKNKSVQEHIKDKSKDKSYQTTLKKKSVTLKAKLNKADQITDNITEPSDTSRLSVSFSGSTTTFEEIPENNSNNTLYKIKLHSQLYLGLSQDTNFVIETLVNTVQQPHMHILITLKKIRLNDSYSRLAVDFGLQKGTIAKVIRKTLPLIAHFMKELIHFPEKSEVKYNLPIAFRSRFSKTQSIIDWFEIQIQQPSNAMHNFLTWSNDKGCNTLKYLISLTPHGSINFISGGYGGRVDDAALFQDCNIIDHIPTGSTILADKGFKHIASIVENKGCKLIRPPSVKTGAVRIHVERSIGRLRSFKMLAPHACVNVKMLPVFDDIVYVACGLVNLQAFNKK